ncbi:TIGR03086 family metal-binding protein [Kitasatospora mediocidica]|uniref:TIGR03086 family metal-binding protein n=1 Tax=Kitasatospora mediocidica TaxID=58352 RepID=UPI0006919570|nr:TIGR03086 family metal-binding protein [Kitasatospora mediocidica]
MAHDTASRRQREVLRLYTEALASFGRRVHLVAANQWTAPTPCSAWSVYDLVHHLTVRQLWVPELLMGATAAEVGDRLGGGPPDGGRAEHPAAAWTAAAEAAREAFAVPGAFDLTVHPRHGDRSALDYCTELILDATVHTWDLARATGGDAHLAPELVEFALHEATRQLSRPGAADRYAPAVESPATADPQTRLLALLGRRVGACSEVDPEFTW